jgi:hypothetical protein
MIHGKQSINLACLHRGGLRSQRSDPDQRRQVARWQFTAVILLASAGISLLADRRKR